MPQPLSQVDRKVGYVLGVGEVPFTAGIASLAFAVINLWAQIDAKLGSVIVSIMAADPEPALAMFTAVSSSEAKRDMLYAAADNSLSADAAALIKATVDSCKASRRERNSMAHDIWGRLNTAAAQPICVAAKDFAAHEATSHRIATGPSPHNLVQLDRSKIMVWSQQDFIEAANRRPVASKNRTAALSSTRRRSPNA
jgi:hypothetical protein